MRTRTGLAGVMGATSALALLTASPAKAHDTATATPAVLGPQVSQRTLLTSLVTSPLDRLETWASTLRAKVAAIPDGTVLTGRSREMAQRQKSAAVRTAAFLGDVQGLTAAQQARVDAVRADLTAAAAGLKALLANRAPDRVVAPAAVRTVSVSDDKVLATDRHRCDGWGGWDGRDGDRWDGDRVGFRHHWRR